MRRWTIPFADRDRRSHGVLEKPVHAKAGIFEAHQEVPIPVTDLLLGDRANDVALITPDCVRAGKASCGSAESRADKHGGEAFAHLGPPPVAQRHTLPSGLRSV